MGNLIFVGVVYLLICGFTGGYMAVQKGRFHWEGILFGLVFGPFGLIAEACMPDKISRR